MTDDAVDARLALARSVGAEAGALALEFWRKRVDLAIEAKASLQDIVSEADRAVERLIRERVAAAYPEDGFLGEEYGLTEGRSGFAGWSIRSTARCPTCTACRTGACRSR